MSTNKKNTEEEVDLGSLFVIIGRGFSKLFNFIAKIFKGLFHLLVLFLIFIKKHFIKLAIAGVLGGLIGGYFHFKKEDAYISSMVIQPNYKSAGQLYFGINYYNNLIKQEETNKLAEVFNISNEEAISLKKITIEPIINENDIINSFDEAMRKLDTLAVESYTFKDYKTAFTHIDYKFHVIEVTSADKDIFSLLKPAIVNILKNNEYFSRVVKLNVENYNRSDSIFRQDLSSLDSLSKVYMKAIIEESKKDFKGTNIDLGNSENVDKELELYTTKRDINGAIIYNSRDRAERLEIVNVISDFQPVGEKVKGLENNLAVLGFVSFIGLMFFFLLLVELNKFLENYKK